MIPSADKAISDFIDIPLHQIWPSRYLANGQRRQKSDQVHQKYSAKSSARHCKKSHKELAVGLNVDCVEGV
jgi:hypothetical protein